MKTEILVPSLKNSFICVHDVTVNRSTTEYEWHIHTECELLYVMDGKMLVWVGENECTLNKGDIIFVNENVPHKTKTEANSKIFLMQMRHELEDGAFPKYLHRYISRTSDDSAVFYNGTEENLELSTAIFNIIKENEERKKSYDKFIKAEISKIFAYLYRYDVIKEPVSHLDSKNINRIIPVLDFVDKHYAEPLTLGDASNILNVDKAHFCRIFKKVLDITFIQYLNFVRVLNAEKMLLSTDKSIAEIAESVGFSSPAYFAENFKLNMSISPSSYKKIKLSKN